MKARSTIRAKNSQAGVALLIAIFVLLLISVVAIALVVSSGTESALAGNYRNATGVYYAALAGLEEGRGRLSSSSSNSFSTTAAPGFMPSPPGTPLAVGLPIYIINPAGGEPIAPWDPGSLYPDTEFNAEFGSSGFSLPNPSPSTLSLSNAGGLQGPLYKWVRINAVSEKSLNLDVTPFDGAKSHTKKVFYDGTLNDINSGGQVLEVTSFAVLPNGSQKMLQYLVAPSILNLAFPSALTLDGPAVTFYTSGNSNFLVNGIDQQDGGNCSPVESQKYAVGTTNSASTIAVTNHTPPGSPPPYNPGIPFEYGNLYGNYLGTGNSPTSYSVGDISASLVPAFQTVNSLDGPQGVVQTLDGMADQHVTGPAVTLPDFGTASPLKMVTTVVTGDLTLGGSANGYGLLVVTGNLTMSGSASWHGIILVIGQGSLTIPSTGSGKIDGAVLIATTRGPGPGYSLLPGLGGVTFNIPNPNFGNQGFYYNSCWVQAALPFGSYKILSFHEIPQP